MFQTPKTFICINKISMAQFNLFSGLILFYNCVKTLKLFNCKTAKK